MDFPAGDLVAPGGARAGGAGGGSRGVSITKSAEKLIGAASRKRNSDKTLMQL